MTAHLLLALAASGSSSLPLLLLLLALALLLAASIIGVIIAGFGARAPAPALPPADAPWSFSRLALIFVLLTYGGWNEAAYISAEARDARRGILRGLVLGLGAVTLFYVGVNFAFLHGLGRAALAASSMAMAFCETSPCSLRRWATACTSRSRRS